MKTRRLSVAKLPQPEYVWVIITRFSDVLLEDATEELMTLFRKWWHKAVLSMLRWLTQQGYNLWRVRRKYLLEGSNIGAVVPDINVQIENTSRCLVLSSKIAWNYHTKLTTTPRPSTTSSRFNPIGITEHINKICTTHFRNRTSRKRIEATIITYTNDTRRAYVTIEHTFHLIFK